jgi:hypothetical protein
MERIDYDQEKWIKIQNDLTRAMEAYTEFLYNDMDSEYEYVRDRFNEMTQDFFRNRYIP